MKSNSQKCMENTTIITFFISVILIILYKFFQNFIIFNLFIFTSLICYHLGIRIINGTITPKFKNKLKYNSFHFKNKKFENKIYEKLNVKKWKDSMPTYTVDEFSLEKYSLDEIVINMCNAELVHELNAILGLMPIIISIVLKLNIIWIIVIVISSILSAFMDFVFVFIQRYNRPRVVKILERKKKTEEKEAQNENKESKKEDK